MYFIQVSRLPVHQGMECRPAHSGQLFDQDSDLYIYWIALLGRFGDYHGFTIIPPAFMQVLLC